MINASKSKTGNSHRPTIGLLSVADFRSSLALELVAGVNAAAKEFDVNLINFCNGVKYSVGDVFNASKYYKRIFPYITRVNLDGVISWASSLTHVMSFDEVEQFHTSLGSMPVACIGMQIKGIPSFMIDNAQGMEQIMSHLTDVHGFTKIAFIGDVRGYSHNFYNEERYNAYCRFLESRNLPLRKDLVYILDSIETKEIYKAVNTLFSQRKLVIKREIEAIVTISDIVSNRLTDILQNLQIQVPEDIAVIGFNNTFAGIRSNPPLTTVDPMYFRYGHSAMEQLLLQMEGKQPEPLTRMPVELLVRESCGCRNTSGTDVSPFQPEKMQQVKKQPIGQCISLTDTAMMTRITRIIHLYDPDFLQSHIEDLISCINSDLSRITTDGFINALKKYFFDIKYPLEKILTLHVIISEMRKLFIAELTATPEQVSLAEDIFHQARIMISLSSNYLTMVGIRNTYQLGKMAYFAADYNAVNNFTEFEDLFKTHLSDFEIPGAFVVVYDEPDKSGKNGKITAVHVTRNTPCIDYYNMDIPVFSLLSDKFLPAERFSLMFQLCNYREIYKGYILFELGPMDIPLYDTLRMIISPSIIRISKSDDRFSESAKQRALLKNLLRDDIDKSVVFSGSDSRADAKNRQRLSPRTIIDCLYKHIDEPTDINKFANDLQVSVSTLVRRTKNFLGCSAQKLHEKLKMEKAMGLLKNNEYSIAEIAQSLGYNNQFYFSSVFKRFTGIAPANWKKANVQ
ncbi:MAG: substrate-binding domain-containing protein [Spirochaetales bacterium]|nr:substrate-binding domain-containing protein [Spirochaetales bacterium]